MTRRTVNVELSTTGLDAQGRPQRVPILTDDGGGLALQAPPGIEPDLEGEHMLINIGPQHPATHGVLRLVLELDGETVVRCIPHIGYLHCGFEKIGEYRQYNQIICWTDREDYLNSIGNNVAFALGAERLFGIEITERCKVLRVIASELSRIMSHLVWLGTFCIDIGAFTPFLWAFQRREEIYRLLEKWVGARLTTSATRVGGMLSNESLFLLTQLMQGGSGAFRVAEGEEAPLPGVPDLALRRERAANVYGAETLGFKKTNDLLAGLGQGDVLVVVGEDLAGIDAGAVSRASDVIVISPVLPESATSASVVLPIANFSEEEGTVTNLRGRVQRFTQARQAPGETRPSWLVLGDLLGAMGKQANFFLPSEVFSRLASSHKSFAGLSYDTIGFKGLPVVDAPQSGPKTPIAVGAACSCSLPTSACSISSASTRRLFS